MSGDMRLVPGRGAPLDAESYRSYEAAKASDPVLGGDNIAQIRSYAAYARAQAQAIHKTIAATDGIDDVAAIKAEATETAQTFAKVGIYADQRIGEILRELPTRQGKRTDVTSSPVGNEVTKSDALKEAGFTTKTAAQLEQLAANPKVVEAVIAKATAEGRVVSRKQVLDAISDMKRAERERDAAKGDLEDAYRANELIEREVASLRKQAADAKDEIAALERQNDELHAQKNPEPQVVEREVEVESEEARRRIAELEQDNRQYSEDYQRLRRRNEELRRELDRAKDILGMSESTQDVRRDVQYLISATKAYVRQYGGLTWTFERISEVDAPTRDELRSAVRNLATFSASLMEGIEAMDRGMGDGR